MVSNRHDIEPARHRGRGIGIHRVEAAAATGPAGVPLRLRP
ncbi:MAG: hypothetical protein AVDCRST_MAG83-2972 [uncultured Arthrobacter sp.]|uniref:Uncharacterized protein n=1 Tax=uncultured Arthrobacter sp. TaxID=114050 RepID=A0A6J4J1X9_9MICC|nr:MAG: hypothetical protein AVDCRST_MAG83-2972 [uncultured Arthrobacter sp.]